MSVALLAVVGAICLSVALVEAWLLVLRFSAENGPVAKLIPGSKDLLRSHLDYLMMAQFLFVFFGLARLLTLSFPVWIVAALGLGAFFNPLAFLIRAMRPTYLTSPPPLFTAFISLSCIATTVGYLSVGWMVAWAACKGP